MQDTVAHVCTRFSSRSADTSAERMHLSASTGTSGVARLQRLGIKADQYGPLFLLFPLSFPPTLLFCLSPPLYLICVASSSFPLSVLPPRFLSPSSIPRIQLKRVWEHCKLPHRGPGKHFIYTVFQKK